MIASLRGKLESLGNDWAIINVGGIGFQVFMPTSTMSHLSALGREVQLYTHLHVREDILALYGFAAPEELRLFQLLLTVSGIGPKLGLAILSAMDGQKLVTAIASRSIAMLTEVPGIGKKTAERIILELKDKISALGMPAPTPQLAEESAEVIEALTSLGYSAAEATRAVAALPATPDLTLEEKIKLALQYFGRR